MTIEREQAIAKLVTPAEAQHALDRLKPYQGVTNSWGSREALLITVDFLRSRFGKARCDSDGVSDCIRCQTMFLVRLTEQLLVATSEAGEADHVG